jgi:6-phosphogluconolactonase
MITGDTRELIISNDPSGLAKTAVKIFIQSAKEKNDPSKNFNVAISGGSTPRLMYRILASEPYLSNMPWGKLHLFWVDERCVPVYDEASNYGTAKMDMIDKVPLKEHQLHAMPVQMDPQEGAIKYEDELVKHFGLKPGEFPRFDLIVLGVGKDGHTASLFPGQSALIEKNRQVLAVKGGNPHVNRLTLTFPVINQANKIMILISGEGKAEIVRRIFQEREANLPIQKVQPEEGKLIWLIDRKAASLLSDDTYMHKKLNNKKPI